MIICGGNDETFAQAIDMVRYGIGTVSNVNYFGGTGNLPFPKFSGGRGMAGKTIHTELAEGGRVRIERMLSMVKYGRIHPERLVTHHLTGLDKIVFNERETSGLDQSHGNNIEKRELFSRSAHLLR